MTSEETFTNSYPRGIKEKERITDANGQMGSTLLIAITSIIARLVLIIIVCLAVKCSRDRKAKHRRHQHNHMSSTNSISDGHHGVVSMSGVNKYSTDSLSTHHTQFGTLQRNNRRATPTQSIKSNGHASYGIMGVGGGERNSMTDYENGVLPLPTDAAVNSPKGKGQTSATNTLNRFPHIHSNGGTMQRNGNNKGGNSLTLPSNGHANGMTNGMSNGMNSDSDSWMDSSRSRETSPASSIPPGMPAFRVIPLGDHPDHHNSAHHHLPSDPAAFTTLGNGHNPAYPRNSSNLGSDLGSNPSDRPQYAGMYPRSGSEAGSNAPSDNTWNTPNGGNGAATASQPQLRKNMYWV